MHLINVFYQRFSNATPSQPFYLINIFGLNKYFKSLKGLDLGDYISLVNATAQISKIQITPRVPFFGGFV